MLKNKTAICAQILFCFAIIASQFFFFSYVFDSSQHRLFYFVFYSTASLIALLFYINRLPYLYFVPVILFFIGWNMSYTVIQSAAAFVFYGLSAAALTINRIIELKLKEPYKISNIMSGKYHLEYGFVVLFAIFSIVGFSFSGFMRGFIFNSSSESNFLLNFFPLRSLGVCGNDICSAPFSSYVLLIIPAVFAYVVYEALKYIKNKRINTAVLLLAVFVISVSGKFVIMSLSTNSIGLLEAKIKSPVDCAYYHFASQIKNPQDFVKNYIKDYQVSPATQTSHLKGHPPLATLFYWMMIKTFTANPTVIGIIFCVLSSLIILPLFYITKQITGDVKTGIACAFIYSMTPFNLILSSSGIDSMVLLFIASSLAVFMAGSASNKFYISAAGGVLFGINAFLTFGTFPLLAALPMVFFIKSKTDLSGFINMIKHVSAFIGGIIVFYLIFQVSTGFKFDYVLSFKAARDVIRDVSNRTYIIWSWANFIHWYIYASVAVISLFVYRFIKAADGTIKMDWYSLASLVMILITFVSCMGRGEQNRMWIYLAVYVLPPAMFVLGKMEKNKFILNERLLLFASAAVFLNTVLLEIFITDFI